MAETRDFLLEIGCEEMPSAPLMKAQEQLSKIVAKGLDDAGLAHGSVRTLSTPRRLAVIVDGCATATEEIHEVIRGPKTSIAFDADGNATRAAEGFARKNGTTADALVRRVEADGNEYVFAERTQASVSAITLLSSLCEQTIANIGMCLFLLPVVGLTLPFFSYGGSSIVTLFAAMGIVSGIKKRSRPEWLNN